MTVRFHRAATAELVEARNWYARSGLGDAFAREVGRIVSLIDQFPARFPYHGGSVRRASLRRFPFSIYFEEVDDVRYI